jgi:Nucleotidyl transferase AbiEii toxin, Type IV TA system
VPESADPPALAWREENRDIFAQTIAAAAEQLSVPQLAVEKDYWVCQALRAIEEPAPGETIFKGGTSLEKQRLIERFSEDIDLLVVGAYDSRRAIERALKGRCIAAQNALPGSVAEKRTSGGKPGSMHRSVYLSAPLSQQPSSSAIADPGGILVELGQSGGDHPADRRPVTSILARQLVAADVPIEVFADLAPFEVLMLHRRGRCSRSCCGSTTLSLMPPAAPSRVAPHRAPVLRHLGAPGRQSRPHVPSGPRDGGCCAHRLHPGV